MFCPKLFGKATIMFAIIPEINETAKFTFAKTMLNNTTAI